MSMTTVGASPHAAAPPHHADIVQSVARAFTLLETLADHGGALSLSQLAAESGISLPTIHRLARTLAELGYLRQEPSRRYALGPKLIRLGESSSRMLDVWARPHLEQLVAQTGESANLAQLDGDQIVYIAQVPSHHSMRMFTEVGRRGDPHCTAVGKAIMSQMPREHVLDILACTGMARHTENTITDPDLFLQHLAWSAEHGYALDEGEQEVGVRCVAMAVPGVPSRLALSVSGPLTRMTQERIAHAVPLMSQAAEALSANLSY